MLFETASIANVALALILLALLIVLWWCNAVVGRIMRVAFDAVRRFFTLTRNEANPVLVPVGYHEWESHSVFNPAAVLLDGRVHLLYRALGSDGMSRIGYASSKDGIHFDERLLHPVFELKNPRQCDPSKRRFDPVLYPSGGSWGGCEDPRVVEIDGVVHMTFNAFDGWDFVRIGETRLPREQFLKKWWSWSTPILLSPPGQVHKNWVLFPEKIQGKYAILHSINPDIQIDYIDRLEDLSDGKTLIKSRFGSKEPRTTWDTWVRGVGPPPIKTSEGWLVLYHATEASDPGKYKLGALLLERDNPQRVRARSQGPLLSPDTPYENYWKQGVVYSCGAVVKDETLFIYYGGGDHTVNIAHAPLAAVVRSILEHTDSPFIIEQTSH